MNSSVKFTISEVILSFNLLGFRLILPDRFPQGNLFLHPILSHISSFGGVYGMIKEPSLLVNYGKEIW